MRNKKLYIFIFILISSLFFFIANNSIGKNDGMLESLKDSLPYNLKKKLLDTVFIYKKSQILEDRIKQLEKIMLVKTNGENNFELKKNNEIYIYTNRHNYDNYKISVYGYNGIKKIICLSDKFSKNYKFKISSLSKECENSIFFMGHILGLDRTIAGGKNLYFYFSTYKKQRQQSKNLLVLPITNFYNYSANNFNGLLYDNSVINNYTTKGMPYIGKISSVPQRSIIMWSERTLKSIKNIKEAKIDFDIVYDYHLEKKNLDEYDLIILPMHQEYVSYNFLNKMIDFLKLNENKKILSIGGANFMNEVEFKFHNNEFKYFSYEDKKIKDFQSKAWSFEPDDEKYFKNCKYKNLKDQDFGEMFFPLENKNIKNFFFDIKCENNEIPLVTVSKFGEGNLIEITSDTIGMNFNKFPELKNFIINLVQ